MTNNKPELLLIMEKLQIADGDITVLSDAERGTLIELLDNFCEEMGIILSDVNGGTDIYLN